MSDVELKIMLPSGNIPLIEYRRHFSVEGSIKTDKTLSPDSYIRIELLDSDGVCLRQVKQFKKNNKMWLDCPLLRTYPHGYDDNFDKLKEFGFAPLIVDDIERPEESIHKASNKCFFNDHVFKSMIITASDSNHGLILNDYMNYRDDDGGFLSCLEKGSYDLFVSLYDADDTLLADDHKSIQIGCNPDVAIVRFNPVEHKRRMLKWFEGKGIAVLNDTVPGYLEPYLGKWLYHMGLLRMYLASDLSQYIESRVHVFLYLLDKSSTSYSTELAYLESQGLIEDRDKMHYYYYSYGEESVRTKAFGKKKSKILEFEDDQFIKLLRLDQLIEEETSGEQTLENQTSGEQTLENQTSEVQNAGENNYNLDNSFVNDSYIDLEAEEIVIKAGFKYAFMGLVRPWQLDRADLILKEDNSYEWKNEISRICYRFSDSFERYRELGLKRFDGDKYLGSSALEFYNIFDFRQKKKGDILSLELMAGDKKNMNPRASIKKRIRFI